MAEDERIGGEWVGRRAFLRAASLGSGASLLSGRAGGTGGQSLHTGVYTGTDGPAGRPLVVYRRPVHAERTICNTSVSWQHRVVVPPGIDGEDDAIYADLYAVERFQAGTVLELVDRLSACPRAEGARLFLRRVASPGEW